MNHDLTTTTLKSLDSAPAVDLDVTSKRRAEARLQQILATDVGPSTTGSRVKKRRTSASWVALPLAAAAVGAGVAVVPGLGSPDPAYASWTPEPTPLSATEQTIAGNACINLRGNERIGSDRLVLAERRGEWAAVVYAGSMATTCVMYFPEGSDRAHDISSGGSNLDGAVIPGNGEFSEGAIFQTSDQSLFSYGTNRPTISVTVGVAAPDAEAITITTPDGEEVVATVENGLFVAWWPGQAFGEDTRGDDGTGYGGPQPDLSYRLTLRDGTVINNAQSIRPE